MSGIVEYLQKRASSTFLVSMTVFWCILNWQGLYTTFFVDQKYIYDKFGMTKNEYVDKYFFGFSEHNTCSKIFKIIISPFLAYFYIWWVPKFILNPSYEKDLKYRYARKKMKNKEELDLANEEKRLKEREIETIKAAKELAREKKDQEKKQNSDWDSEYELLYEHPKFNIVMEGLQKVIYGDDYHTRLPSDIRMLIDIWGIGVIVNGGLGDRLEITDKGRHFLGIYTR